MVLGKVALCVAGAAGLYAALLGILLSPHAQRFALYAHKVNTLFWDDLVNSEKFGFAKNQVTAFTIETPDGERLFAWHVLPVNVYAQHEDEIRNEVRPGGPIHDFTKTAAFRLLTQANSEPARVAISFHGNAGHIAQGWRADAHRSIAIQPNTHVFTVDYRGFGHSTGSPTEAGLITDGTTLVNWVMHHCNVPADRIAILGQSLGTAVSSAVALRFADPTHSLLPTQVPGSVVAPGPVLFAGVILVAPFANLPSLLMTYRIGGLVPLLGPLRPFPTLGRLLTSRMIDQWRSDDRLSAYYEVVTRSGSLPSAQKHLGSLQLLHATNDMDITHRQTEQICRRIFDPQDPAVRCVDGFQGPTLLTVDRPGSPMVRVEMLVYGGHNRIIMSNPVAGAILRVFTIG